ncbi:alpha/beta fold hydrolase [Oceanobacillus kapialis]|uniref:Alpha/beta fold hydrolase n=1 Tax=Oceanobacillus kapialis TaxID=481353 RepID=A0ABW5PVH3_9BACI
MGIWKRELLSTTRGNFEIFTKEKGYPLCITHHYSVFNETGDYFADTFTKSNKVFLVNLREAGHSNKAVEPFQLSLVETILDLEAIREELGFSKWGFAGHSTGGMFGLIYGIYFSTSLTFTVIVGAAAREYATFSKDCIYNPKHPDYERMQALVESINGSDVSSQKKIELMEERTKLSLFEPKKYKEFFSKNIHKHMARTRISYFNREIQVFDVTKKLELITIPTLIMCGRYDIQCPIIYSIEMKELIPNSKLVIFERSNHYPFLEEAEEFNQVYNAFVKERDPSF